MPRWALCESMRATWRCQVTSTRQVHPSLAPPRPRSGLHDFPFAMPTESLDHQLRVVLASWGGRIPVLQSKNRGTDGMMPRQGSLPSTVTVRWKVPCPKAPQACQRMTRDEKQDGQRYKWTPWPPSLLTAAQFHHQSQRQQRHPTKRYFSLSQHSIELWCYFSFLPICLFRPLCLLQATTALLQPSPASLGRIPYR